MLNSGFCFMFWLAKRLFCSPAESQAVLGVAGLSALIQTGFLCWYHTWWVFISFLWNTWAHQGGTSSWGMCRSCTVVCVSGGAACWSCVWFKAAMDWCGVPCSSLTTHKCTKTIKSCAAVASCWVLLCLTPRAGLCLCPKSQSRRRVWASPGGPGCAQWSPGSSGCSTAPSAAGGDTGGHAGKWAQGHWDSGEQLHWELRAHISTTIPHGGYCSSCISMLRCTALGNEHLKRMLVWGAGQGLPEGALRATLELCAPSGWGGCGFLPQGFDCSPIQAVLGAISDPLNSP